MEEVFSTRKFAPAKRYAAWQDAICDVYLKVDVKSESPANYRGFIREARFGDVVLTDTLLSEQMISRQNRHVAALDKDCYYIQFIQQGCLHVEQASSTLLSNPASAAIFCASEPYKLHCSSKLRAFYVEVPRAAFTDRFPAGGAPVVAPIHTASGLGRIAAEFCVSAAANADALDARMKAKLGEELIDVIALALESGPERSVFDEGAAQRARLRSIQAWIGAHLADASLNLEKIAKANQISLRQLHYLFEPTGATPSEWIWRRRLQMSYDRLAGETTGLSVTDVAYQCGFSSSSHFSTLFRRAFGLRPSEVRRPR